MNGSLCSFCPCRNTKIRVNYLFMYTGKDNLCNVYPKMVQKVLSLASQKSKTILTQNKKKSSKSLLFVISLQKTFFFF